VRTLWILCVVAGCGGSPPPPTPAPCAAGDEATLVEARLLRGQGYLHRAHERAVEAAGRCAAPEVAGLIAAIEGELDPGDASASVLVREATGHRGAGREVEARRAAARALVAAERLGPLVPVIAGEPTAARSVAFSDDGHALLVGLADGRGLRFDLIDPGAAPVSAPPPPVQDTAASADGRVQASARGAEVVLGDHRLPGHPGPVTAVALDPDGLLLASAGPDGVRLWDTTLAAPMAYLAFAGDGAWLAAGASGRVDGSTPLEGGPPMLRWRVADLELPGFVGWQRGYRRGLLSDLVRRRIPF
jgi:hypothetical protein